MQLDHRETDDFPAGGAIVLEPEGEEFGDGFSGRIIDCDPELLVPGSIQVVVNGYGLFALDEEAHNSLIDESLFGHTVVLKPTVSDGRIECFELQVG